MSIKAHPAIIVTGAPDLTPTARISLIILLALAAGVLTAHGDPEQRTAKQFPITYISATTIYLDGGANMLLGVGDTVRVFRKDTVVAVGVVSAIARHSSAATIVYQLGRLAGSREAVVTKIWNVPTIDSATARDTTALPIPREPYKPAGAGVGSTTVSGRVSVGFNGGFMEDSRLNLAQPFATVRMTIRDIAGSAWTVDVYDHAMADVRDRYALYNNDHGITNRLFRLSLSHNDPRDPYGVSVGRVASVMVPALGTFDGAEAFGRISGLYIGVAGGRDATAEFITGGVSNTKSAVFAGYETNTDMLHRYDGSLAYIRQSESGGGLQREFLAMRNTLTAGSAWSVIQSAEMDLHQGGSAGTTGSASLSNLYAYVQYAPLHEMYFSLGYDAVRPVYYIGQYTNLSDSLRQKNLQHALRGTITAQLLDDLTLNGYAGWSARGAGLKDGYTLGGALRNRDLFRWKLNGTIRAETTSGPYASISTVSADIERMFLGRMDVSLRVGHETITVDPVKQSYSSIIGDLSIYYLLSNGYFVAFSGDGRLDDTMNGLRFSIECGMRF